jgi:tetratricopeptide (TPR) repeat protein
VRYREADVLRFNGSPDLEAQLANAGLPSSWRRNDLFRLSTAPIFKHVKQVILRHPLMPDALPRRECALDSADKPLDIDRERVGNIVICELLCVLQVNEQFSNTFQSHFRIAALPFQSLVQDIRNVLHVPVIEQAPQPRPLMYDAPLLNEVIDQHVKQSILGGRCCPAQRDLPVQSLTAASEVPRFFQQFIGIGHGLCPRICARRCLLRYTTEFVIRYNAGLICQKRGMTEEAVQFYQQALTEEPEFAEALLNLGHALMSLGQEEEARSFWRRAIREKPELAQTYFEPA